MKISQLVLCGAILAASGITAEESSPVIRFFNAEKCVRESKYGIEMQSSLEESQKQIVKMIEDINSQIEDIDAKLGDKDFLDGLSPEGEEDLKSEKEELTQRVQAIQAQASQRMQFEQQTALMAIEENLTDATSKYAPEHNIDALVLSQVALYYKKDFDVTSDLIVLLDKKYDAEQTKKNDTSEAKEKSQSEASTQKQHETTESAKATKDTSATSKKEAAQGKKKK